MRLKDFLERPISINNYGLSLENIQFDYDFIINKYFPEARLRELEYLVEESMLTDAFCGLIDELGLFDKYGKYDNLLELIIDDYKLPLTVDYYYLSDVYTLDEFDEEGKNITIVEVPIINEENYKLFDDYRQLNGFVMYDKNSMIVGDVDDCFNILFCVFNFDGKKEWVVYDLTYDIEPFQLSHIDGLQSFFLIHAFELIKKSKESSIDFLKELKKILCETKEIVF